MSAIYIHVPFCKTRCNYCDFYSSLPDNRIIADYISALKTEIRLRNKYLEAGNIRSIYFGGGTPSLLNTNHLAEILAEIRCHYSLSDSTEVTIEVNPDDLNLSYCHELLQIGFNRISIGTQSFCDKNLQYLGRRHDAALARKALSTAKQAGFLNISADIIYGVPGYDDNSLLGDMHILINMEIQHISTYALTVEENTPLYSRIAKKNMQPPNEDDAARQYLLLTAILEKNAYYCYEISNFAKPGYESMHNSTYWENTPYLGLGPSAHSYNLKARHVNPSCTDTYIRALQNGHIQQEEEILSEKDMFNENILKSLRTLKGIPVSELFIDKPSAPSEKQVSDLVAKYQKAGYIRLNKGILQLSVSGRLYSDMIISSFFWV